MKKINLQSITLHNWRGEKERTTVFHTDAPTYICGDNGLGKSRHFDAFCWLLFGKDSQNRTDFELRTYDEQHQPLHHCECSVEATLTIDGEPLTIKREWVENWCKPKGQIEEVFKNNETRCTWNGVPVTKTEYSKRVKSLFGLSSDDKTDASILFMIVTNPLYFPTIMKWQQQREALLTMAGSASDYDIAADDANFKALLDELSGKSLADFRKEIASTKKKYKDELDGIPTRIDEVQRNTPEAEDWNAITEEINAKKHEVEQIELQIRDDDARDAAKRKERNNLNQKIEDAREQQRCIIRKHKMDAQVECDKKNEYRRGLEASLKKVHAELSEANTDLRRNKERINYLHTSIDTTDKQLAELREEWYKINASLYDVNSDICPCCGQRLPNDMLMAARDKFTENKSLRLADNNAKGKQLASQMASLKGELEKLEAEDTLLNGKVETAENGIKKFTEAVLANPAATVEEVACDTIPAWVALQQQINELQQQLDTLDAAIDAKNMQVAELKDLTARKGDLQLAVDMLNNRLAKREQIEQSSKRIAELGEKGRELTQKIADLEKREYIAAQFAKKKIEDCEARINGMFKLVRFKLFDYTLDGNEYECCVPLINGVPYQVANTASQINAGLDIINTLCRFYNISAPVFLDGAESVNRYIDTQSQIIFLQVTNDKQLTIK